MKDIDNIISLGQDCSTFLCIKAGGKHKASFFDSFAIYSNDYLKFFDVNFLTKNRDNVSIYCKSSIKELLQVFSVIQHKDTNKKIRLRFLVVYGDKYTNGIIDVIHVDDDVLYKLVESSSLQEFLIKIEQNVIPHIKNRINKNIEYHLNIFKEPNKRYLFVRTIKHKMTYEEVADLNKLFMLIAQKFKNSQLLVLTDVKENLEYKLAFVKFLQFEHWKQSPAVVEQFNKIVETL